MLKNKLNFVPFKHKDIDHWRNARTGGISYLDEKTNIIIHFEVSDTTYFYVCNGEKSHDKFDGKINFSSTLVPYTTKTSWIDSKIEEMKMLLESGLIPEINKSCEHCAYLEGGKEF